MAERIDGKTWFHRAIFVAVAFLLIVADLVPLDHTPAAWAGPDLLLVAALVWVVRKPTYLPVFMVAAIFLLADLLFLRPPGLFAALVVILTEALRRRHSEFRNMPFAVEWGSVAGGIIAVTLAYRAVLILVASPRPPLVLSISEMVTTMMVYPVVVVLAHLIFGIKRAAPGETGSRGQLI